MKLKSGWRSDLDTWVSPVFANMLWVLLSIFIITMPLALVGLLAVMFHWIDDRRTQVFSIFFGTIRRVWVKAYLLFALDLVIGGFIALNALIFTRMELALTNPLALLSLSATLFTTIIFVAFNVPAWTMVATWDAPLNKILPFCIRLVFAQPFWTIALGIAFVLPFVISLMLPVAVFIVLTGAVAAYIAGRGTMFLVQKYIPRDEFKLIDVI
jgi:uncharacterized membrane protein YesL